MTSTSPKSIFYGIDNATDDGSTTGVYTAWYSPTAPLINTSKCTIGWSWNLNSRFTPTNFWKEPVISPEIVRRYAKYLTAEEKAYLRKINFKPTKKGVRNHCRWHDHWPIRTKVLPAFQVRLDRRVPTWRPGRWKSLA